MDSNSQYLAIRYKNGSLYIGANEFNYSSNSLRLNLVSFYCFYKNTFAFKKQIGCLILYIQR